MIIGLLAVCIVGAVICAGCFGYHVARRNPMKMLTGSLSVGLLVIGGFVVYVVQNEAYYDGRKAGYGKIFSELPFPRPPRLPFPHPGHLPAPHAPPRSWGESGMNPPT